MGTLPFGRIFCSRADAREPKLSPKRQCPHECKCNFLSVEPLSNQSLSKLAKTAKMTKNTVLTSLTAHQDKTLACSFAEPCKGHFLTQNTYGLQFKHWFIQVSRPNYRVITTFWVFGVKIDPKIILPTKTKANMHF